MFFIKFIEHRGAKKLGLHCFKEAKRLTDAYTMIKVSQARRSNVEAFEALKYYTMEYCKEKR